MRAFWNAFLYTFGIFVLLLIADYFLDEPFSYLDILFFSVWGYLSGWVKCFKEHAL